MDLDSHESSASLSTSKLSLCPATVQWEQRALEVVQPFAQGGMLLAGSCQIAFNT